MAELRALTVRQPVAYLAGVLAGDGYLSKPTRGRLHGILGLHVADEDFARAFAEAVRVAYGVGPAVRRERAGYWRVARYNGYGRFDGLLPYRSFRTDDDDERAAWLRGFFDSEGNASLLRLRKGVNSWSRRVCVFNTDLRILGTAADFLAALGYLTVQSHVPPDAGHLGTLPVYQLRLRQSRENFERFATQVGSSIGRKQRTLDAIANSYTSAEELLAITLRTQACGAASKRRRRGEQLPEVLEAIRAIHAEGGEITDTRLRKEVSGFWPQYRVHGYKELVAMALQDSRPVLGGDQVAACLSVLRDAERPLSITEIVEAVHAAGYAWERVKIRRALSYMARTGRAMCVKRGFWEVGSHVA
jgi:hypothetical protein